MADAILNAREMQEIERAAFAEGIEAETLMDQAGEGIANAILEEEPRPGRGDRRGQGQRPPDGAQVGQERGHVVDGVDSLLGAGTVARPAGGEDVPLAFSDAAVQANTESTLTLVPHRTRP